MLKVNGRPSPNEQFVRCLSEEDVRAELFHLLEEADEQRIANEAWREWREGGGKSV